MGLIKKISDENKFATKNIPKNIQCEEKTESKPDPCQVCHCVGFWFDVYGGGPHCTHCAPPASRALVKSEILARQPTDEELDRDFERKYVSYEIPEKRGKDGEVIRPGKLIIQRRDFSFTNPMSVPTI